MNLAATGLVPVMEVGGTHVTAAVVGTTRSVPLVIEQHRVDIDADGTAEQLVDAFVAAASRLRLTDSLTWGVAMPGPFDYEAGIGRFEHVGKFESLNGFDLKQALLHAMVPRPRDVRFLNDADAFGLGECAAGAGRHHDRAVCLTLGTGVGSAFIADGTPVNSGPSVPPDGSAHLLVVDGAALEETVSRRAIRRAYHNYTGEWLDVHHIAQRGRQEDEFALAVLDNAMRALGEAIGPWLLSFEATVVVVGGSISKSWDILKRPLRTGLLRVDQQLARLELKLAEIPADAPLVGAAASVAGVLKQERTSDRRTAPPS